MRNRGSRLGWILGVAVVLLAGPLAWAQQASNAPDNDTDKGKGRAKDKPPAADAKAEIRRSPAGMTGKASPPASKAVREWLEEQGRSMREGARHPEHTRMIEKVREEIELLEAQVAAKAAQIRLAEARLKQARIAHDAAKKKAESSKDADDDLKRREAETEVDVLEAEFAAERAEIKEPQVLLKHARRHLEDLEDGDEGPGAGHPGMMGHMGMGMGMEHPGMGMEHPGMAMQHPGMAMHPFAMHHMSMERMTDVDDRLWQLREAIEELEEQVTKLAGAKRP